MPVPIVSLADGQVGIVAAAIYGPGVPIPGPVSLILSNVGGNDETVTITVKRGSTGTPRRLIKLTLSADEQLYIIGLPLSGTDTILAVTTDAASVDYLVFAAPDAAPLKIYSLDANGAVKSGGAALAGAALQQAFDVMTAN